jgi:hypothetical protein
MKKVKSASMLAIVAMMALVYQNQTLHAAVITWDPVGTISADTDVNTQGTLVQALHLGDATGTTVNGVTFSNGSNGVGLIGAPLTLGSGSGSLTFGSEAGYYVDAGANTYTSNTAPFSGLSSSYQSLISAAEWSNGNSATSLTLTLNGLTTSQDYLVQFWVNDPRNISAVWSRTATFTAGNASGALDYNVSDANGGVGQFVVGRFTADATTQSITWSGQAGTFQLNGYQLRDVSIPEPSTSALVLVAGLALLHFARRKQVVA